MPRLTRRPPKLCYHRGTAQAYVNTGGNRLHLGHWPGGPKTAPPKAVQDAYNTFLAEFIRTAANRPPVNPLGTTIAEAAVQFIAWARQEYQQSNQATVLKCALTPLVMIHGRDRIAEFGPRKLLAFQEYLAAEGRLTRQGINRAIGRIREFFRWAAVRELVPGSLLESLRAVMPLRAGRTTATEHEVRQAVPLGDVETTLRYLQPVVQDMIRLQLFSAARPGEIVNLSMDQLDRTDPDVWIYRPHSHKTKWRGQTRAIPFGPQAIEILKRYLRADGRPLFSAIEAMEERRERRRATRKSKVQPSQEDRRVETPARPAGERYRGDSYRRAIARACLAAGVPVWSPNQLRKAAATTIRSRFALPHAQAVLGHADEQTTATYYAQQDLARIKEVAKEIG